ncbi:MAG: hypothetical protein Q8L60_10605 [Gammaproteobacteria bacterium]|nr:hypothetical protein [Gammaproteobacteria bacterium]MDP2346798.1 hypothetical protein [Gammaproteobacteria bacterium]
MLSSNSQLTPSTRSVTDDELASKQMENITSKDSVMRQRAETFGKNYATSRGLLDSSIGAQATFGAFVDRAAPLAMADAERYGQVADQNLGYENQFKLSDKNFAQQGLLQKDGQTFTSGENALDRKSQADLQKSDQSWRSKENSSDRGFSAAQNDRDRQLAREEMESRERIAVSQSKADLEKLGITMDFEKYQLNASTQNQIQLMLHNEIAAIRADGNLDPASKEIAIQNAIDGAANTARAVADAMKTQVTPTIPTFNADRASQVLVDEAARQGYDKPSMAELNMAMEYAKANNLTEEQMRAYVRDTLTQQQPTAPQEAPQSSQQDLMALAAQYGYNATPEEAAYVAQYAAANGLSAEEVVMQELRNRGIVT